MYSSGKREVIFWRLTTDGGEAENSLFSPPFIILFICTFLKLKPRLSNGIYFLFFYLRSEEQSRLFPKLLVPTSPGSVVPSVLGENPVTKSHPGTQKRENRQNRTPNPVPPVGQAAVSPNTARSLPPAPKLWLLLSPEIGPQPCSCHPPGGLKQTVFWKFSEKKRLSQAFCLNSPHLFPQPLPPPLPPCVPPTHTSLSLFFSFPLCCSFSKGQS